MKTNSIAIVGFVNHGATTMTSVKPEFRTPPERNISKVYTIENHRTEYVDPSEIKSGQARRRERRKKKNNPMTPSGAFLYGRTIR